MFSPIIKIPHLDELYLTYFSAPRHPEWLRYLDYSLYNYFYMTDKQLENMSVFRKASRCATLFELLAEELGLNPLEPSTSWKDIAKAYSLTMEEAHSLQQSEDNETAKD